MYNIVLISSSVRIGRASHRVALFFKKFIEEAQLASVDIVDLLEYQFPLFDERLSKMKDPSPKMVQFSEKVKGADGILIVTPEYNGGYPAALKNVVDLLYAEWKRKPIALASVSNGQYAGSQVLTSLSFSLHKIGATVVPSMYRVANVQDVYDENGITTDPKIPKFARSFVDDLIWYMEAKKRMETD
ncbi:MAG TPA: NAD(P)H-dependent oxidoreductase [Chitinophagaceae bacterium]|nr:NAD(P)H-dependent oxidoreductase [Chitinophagaceae bacterium]